MALTGAIRNRIFLVRVFGIGYNLCSTNVDVVRLTLLIGIGCAGSAIVRLTVVSQPSSTHLPPHCWISGLSYSRGKTFYMNHIPVQTCLRQISHTGQTFTTLTSPAFAVYDPVPATASFPVPR